MTFAKKSSAVGRGPFFRGPGPTWSLFVAFAAMKTVRVLYVGSHLSLTAAILDLALETS